MIIFLQKNISPATEVARGARDFSPDDLVMRLSLISAEDIGDLAGDLWCHAFA